MKQHEEMDLSWFDEELIIPRKKMNGEESSGPEGSLSQSSKEDRGKEEIVDQTSTRDKKSDLLILFEENSDPVLLGKIIKAIASDPEFCEMKVVRSWEEADEEIKKFSGGSALVFLPYSEERSYKLMDLHSVEVISAEPFEKLDSDRDSKVKLWKLLKESRLTN